MNKEKELIKIAKTIDWKCELCGYDKKLANHHVSYIPERILVVCYSCHFKIHLYTPELCPAISSKDFRIVKRLLYPAKLEEEHLDGNWQHIKNRLDLFKDPTLLKQEGKSPSEAEMKEVANNKAIISGPP